MGGKKQEGGEARTRPWVKGCLLTLDAEKGKEVAVSSESPRGISSADTVASTHRD